VTQRDLFVSEPIAAVEPIFGGDVEGHDFRVLADLVGSGAARTLLARFGNLADAASADPVAVEREVGATAAKTLRAVQRAAYAMAGSRVNRRQLLTTWGALTEYLMTTLAGLPREQFRVLFLDKKNQLIADELMGIGTVDHAPAYPREVIRRALELNASAIFLTHNHPSGDPAPSPGDVSMTRQMKDACKAVGLTLHDHVVVSRAGCASLQALGLI
jgi:DNA repair protein RadC